MDIAKINQQLLTTNTELDMLIKQPNSINVPSFIENLKMMTVTLNNLPRGVTPHVPEGISQRVSNLINALPNIRQAGELQAAAVAFKKVLELNEAGKTRKAAYRVEAINKTSKQKK